MPPVYLYTDQLPGLSLSWWAYRGQSIDRQTPCWRTILICKSPVTYVSNYPAIMAAYPPDFYPKMMFVEYFQWMIQLHSYVFWKILDFISMTICYRISWQVFIRASIVEMVEKVRRHNAAVTCTAPLSFTAQTLHLLVNHPVKSTSCCSAT